MISSFLDWAFMSDQMWHKPSYYSKTRQVKLCTYCTLTLVHLIPSVAGLGRNLVYSSFCSAKKTHKRVSTSLTKQTTGDKSLLS